MSPVRFSVLVLTNLSVYIGTVLWTLGCVAAFPLAFLTTFAVTRWPADKVTRFLVWVYGRGWMAVVSPFVRFRREGFAECVGTGPAPARRSDPCVLVVNHLSFFDTFFMGALPFHDVTFAVRAWPFKMPWFTPFMRLAKYMDVESSSRAETFAAAKAALARGCRILFFPEGHRSRDGKLHRFHSGAFRLALENGVPLVPLVITGTDRFFPPGRWWFAPARVHLRALRSFDPTAFSGLMAHRKLRDAVWAEMEGVIAKSLS